MGENLFDYGFSFDLDFERKEKEEKEEKENKKRTYEVRVIKERNTNSRLWIIETFHGYTGQYDEVQLILKADKETIHEEREIESQAVLIGE
jgi:hypothetical protein